MAVNNSLTKSKQRLGFTSYLTQDAVKDQINKVVGGKNGTRFITSIVSAVNSNPALAECTNQSILASALLGEALNLSPSPQLGFYYLVPFKNNRAGVTEAQFQLGYKGYIQLAIRSGQYKKLNVLPIKEGELVSFDPLNEEIVVNLIDDEVERENTPTAGYYAVFEYNNGFRKAVYWSKAKMESHALRYSKGYQAKKGYTFWEKDFDAMAMKTLLRHLISRWGIMSTEMMTAIDSDMAVIHEDGTKDYVDTEDIVDMPQPQEEPKADTDKSQFAMPEPVVDDTATAESETAAALFGGNDNE